MSERTETPGWVIQVGESGERFQVGAGESVLIGRTPLRPAPVTDSLRRIMVEDPGKSMSKRHLKFTVRADGSASLQDLHSTNGTYVVRASGDLLRLPLEQEYPLTQAVLRIQCGDVPLEIRREEVPAQASPQAAEPAVAPSHNLFTHQAAVFPEGVDSPALSVDDILDMRAGEPTEMFDAKKVRRQLEAERSAAAAPTAFPSTDFARLKRDLEERSQAQDVQPGDLTGSPSAAAASVAAAGAVAAAGVVDATAAAANSPAADPVTASAQVFEPGSVFDRLTRGELGPVRPAVEIGDLNSDDAQHTSDQSLQFEMAKHQELLPFLALNPHLYDDLYAWLEAIGDPDIMAALRSNSGYAAYREGRD